MIRSSSSRRDVVPLASARARRMQDLHVVVFCCFIPSSSSITQALRSLLSSSQERGSRPITSSSRSSPSKRGKRLKAARPLATAVTANRKEAGWGKPQKAKQPEKTETVKSVSNQKCTLWPSVVTERRRKSPHGPWAKGDASRFLRPCRVNQAIAPNSETPCASANSCVTPRRRKENFHSSRRRWAQVGRGRLGRVSSSGLGGITGPSSGRLPSGLEPIRLNIFTKSCHSETPLHHCSIPLKGLGPEAIVSTVGFAPTMGDPTGLQPAALTTRPCARGGAAWAWGTRANNSSSPSPPGEAGGRGLRPRAWARKRSRAQNHTRDRAPAYWEGPGGRGI